MVEVNDIHQNIITCGYFLILLIGSHAKFYLYEEIIILYQLFFLIKT